MDRSARALISSKSSEIIARARVLRRLEGVKAGRRPPQVPSRLPVTPGAVALAIKSLASLQKTAEAAALARSSLFAWAADGELDSLREAFARLAREELPHEVVLAVGAVAFTVEDQVQGASYWVKRAGLAPLAR